MSDYDRYLIDLLETPSPDFETEKIIDFVKNKYSLTGDLSPLDSERDQNLRLQTETGDQYVIKIANSAENPAIIDMQLKTLAHIALVDPELPVPRVLLSQEGADIEYLYSENGTKHCVRVITYLPGAPPEDDPVNPALPRPMGACLARLAKSLRGFFHPIGNYELLWDLKHTSKLRQYLCHITDTHHLELATYFLDRFDHNVLPRIPELRAQILHNDMTPDNIVVAENDPGNIVGIIDFGDMTHTLLVVDLATTIAQMLFGHPDPVSVAAEIIASYHEVTPLEAAEIRVLYDLIAARLTMMNVIALWRVTIHPENEEYITGSVEQVWPTIEAWRALDPAAVTKKFFRACGLWEMEEAHPEPEEVKVALESHLERRSRLLGNWDYLFYERPLHIVRGQGVWLYDQDGNRYLDVYNNVAQVGHCHPHVVNAIENQARKLNTNTRYMHGLILELAEQITNRMPDPLSACMFVCTGSEANDLAWQMSRMISGNTGALIRKFAYHGNTSAISQFSSEDIPQDKIALHVQTLFPPTSNTTYPQPDAGISHAIEALAENNHQPAMLILDTGFVSDGIFTAPKGYLSTLYEKTRQAGGLCVADEVQAGFARLGQHFWGYQFDDVIPDIVTLGKPFGNGHPLAAVVTRPEFVEVLNEIDYFNTFGGNPVSCAAGLAVLEVIEKESLQKNALEVGKYLEARLTALRKEYPMLGEIHGSGLLLGIDILKPDGDPDPELADRITNHLRENGVLIGTTGPQYSTLKIRPPLVFHKEHADILLAALTKALDAL